MLKIKSKQNNGENTKFSNFKIVKEKILQNKKKMKE